MGLICCDCPRPLSSSTSADNLPDKGGGTCRVNVDTIGAVLGLDLDLGRSSSGTKGSPNPRASSDGSPGRLDSSFELLVVLAVGVGRLNSSLGLERNG